MPDNIIKDRTDSFDNYGEYEYRLTRATVVPLFRRWNIEVRGKSLIDIGCGAGGSSHVFHEEGARVVGLDIDADRIHSACQRASRHNLDITFMTADVHEPPAGLARAFDLAIVRDVLEHVADPRLFLARVMELLREEGLVFISFPPYYSAFGGHQHHPRSVTRFMPWSHLLPSWLFYRMLPDIPEYRHEIRSLNRLTIHRLEEIIARDGYTTIVKELFYIRPSLSFKYGLPIIKAGAMAKRGFVREFLVTGAFFVLSHGSGYQG